MAILLSDSVTLWLLLASAVPGCGGSGHPTSPVSSTNARVVYLTQSAGFRHDVLPLSVQILTAIGPQSGFDVTALDDVSGLTRDLLSRTAAVVFFTSGELPLTADQKSALLDFVKNGRGFVGIHSATDTLYEWAEYGDLIGAYFDGHPWHQKVTIRNEDPQHPATSTLPASFQMNDEIYQFRSWSRSSVHVLLTLDPASVDLTAPDVHRTDRDFALSWTKSYGSGRVFYTALGHEPSVWQDRRFQQHLAGGIRWALGAQ